MKTLNLANLPCGINSNQMKWSKEHDWFVESSILSCGCCYSVLVKEESSSVCPDNGIVETFVDYIEFTEYSLLRQWAGY